MKIKYFTGEVDVKNSEELGDYFIDNLGYANETIVQAYADILFKIHEKIEIYNNFETSKSPKSLNYAIVVILKSLLENEK